MPMSDAAVSFTDLQKKLIEFPQQGELFVTIAPPFSTFVGCPREDEYWDADANTCKPCEVGISVCSDDKYLPGCMALQSDDSAAKIGSSSCMPCAIPHGMTVHDINWVHDANRDCVYECDTGYKDSTGLCTPCSIPSCEVGTYLVPCAQDTDAHCAQCPPKVQQGVFVNRQTVKSFSWVKLRGRVRHAAAHGMLHATRDTRRHTRSVHVDVRHGTERRIERKRCNS